MKDSTMDANIYVNEHSGLEKSFWRAQRVESKHDADFVSAKLGPVSFLIDAGRTDEFANMLDRVADEVRKALK